MKRERFALAGVRLLTSSAVSSAASRTTPGTTASVSINAASGVTFCVTSDATCLISCGVISADNNVVCVVTVVAVTSTYFKGISVEPGQRRFLQITSALISYIIVI